MEDRRELASDGLYRFPLLLIAPALLATLWNALSTTEVQMVPAEEVEAFIDLVFQDQT
ncbi:MAG TPA: hypothetical protein VGB81_11105 [Devosia sp.]|jgi:hypothetical protein